MLTESRSIIIVLTLHWPIPPRLHVPRRRGRRFRRNAELPARRPDRRPSNFGGDHRTALGYHPQHRTRLMDGIEPELVDHAWFALEHTPGVLSVSKLQLSWSVTGSKTRRPWRRPTPPCRRPRLWLARRNISLPSSAQPRRRGHPHRRNIRRYEAAPSGPLSQPGRTRGTGGSIAASSDAQQVGHYRFITHSRTIALLQDEYRLDRRRFPNQPRHGAVEGYTRQRVDEIDRALDQ